MTTTKLRAVAPRARASRRMAPAPVVAPRPLVPGHIAFLGNAEVTTEAGETVLVQALCWPSVPAAWSALTLAWSSVRSGRGEPSEFLPPKPRAPSWIGECGPQLGELFGNTPAEESSVAALVLRTPMQIAVSIVDSRERGATAAIDASAPRQALSGCLESYDQFVRARRTAPCTTLIARGRDAGHGRPSPEDFASCRLRVTDAHWLAHMQLHFWNDAIEPLPLEIAQVVAATVARHRIRENEANPILDAVLTKLSHDGAQLRRATKSRRR